MSRYQQGNKKLTLTITSGDFHHKLTPTITPDDFHPGTTWAPLLYGWKLPGVRFPGGVSNLCRKLESDQCRQVLPTVGRWHVNVVLFCFNGRQVRQRFLVSKFMSSIKCFGLLPQVHAQQRASRFLAKPKFYKLRLGKEKHKVHHVLNKML